jgi:hypothetical protein
VPEMTGTIPAVKERPKVTRRPTIPGPATPQKQPPVKKVELKAEQSLSESTPGVAGHTVTGPDLAAATMPVKKPLVTRNAEAKRGADSNNIGRTMLAKKPLVTKQAKVVAADAKPKQTKAAGQSRWAPLAVGIALGSLAPAIYALAALWDPWGVRIVFPFVQLSGLHEIGFSHELTRNLPQLMLYLQFPLEGLLVASALRRGKRLGAALGTIPPLHFAGGLVLWIVALGSMPPI